MSVIPRAPELAVVKVGGSLYDLPDLGPRLRRWLAEQLAATPVLLVPGGGLLTDAIRHLDRSHGLGEETAHWLALHALTVNAHLLASLLPPALVIGDAAGLRSALDNCLLPVLDVHEFARADELHATHLPHNWAAASDAFAARTAVVFQARQLILLKSTPIPPGCDWKEAGQLGLVDSLFADVLNAAPADLCVRAVNFRAYES